MVVICHWLPYLLYLQCHLFCFIEPFLLQNRCVLVVRLNTAYFAKNCKHINKIIFNCVNNIIGFIFNESFVKKRILCE